MDELTYSVRASLARPETLYRLTGGTLSWDGGELALADVATLRLHGVPGLMAGFGQAMPTSFRCVIQPRQGGRIVIPSLHYRGLGRTENRSAALGPFAAALARRVAAANPGAALLTGLPPGLWWLWAVLLVLVVLAAIGGLVGVVESLRAGPSLDTLRRLVFPVAMLAGGASILRTLIRGRSRPLDLASPRS